MIPKRCGSNKPRRAAGEEQKPKGGTARTIRYRHDMDAGEMKSAVTGALKQRGALTKGWRNGELRHKRQTPRADKLAETEGGPPEGHRE